MRASAIDGGSVKSVAAKALADAIRGAAQARPVVAPARPAEPKPIPEGLSTLEQDLWLIGEEIEETRRQLAQARAPGSALVGRTASLQAQLYSLMGQRRALTPASAPSVEEEERRWRVDADAVLRSIESGVEEAEARGRALQKEETTNEKADPS